jgi:hypothetical protein
LRHTSDTEIIVSRYLNIITIRFAVKQTSSRSGVIAA